MTTQESRTWRFDIRALPIVVKLALGLGLVLVISAFVTTNLVRQVITTARTDAVLGELSGLSNSQAFRVADTIEQEIASLTILGADDTLQALLSDLINQEPPNESAFRLTALAVQQINPYRIANPGLESIALLDTTGRVVAINPIQNQARVEGDQPKPGSWDWFQAAYNNGEGAVYISEPIDDQLTGVRGIHIAIPVYNSGDSTQVLGVLYTVWSLDNLPALGVARSRETFMAQIDGTVLQSSIGLPGDVIYTRLLVEVRGDTSGAFIQTDPQGVPWLYGYTRLSDLDIQRDAITDLDWIIAVREPLSVTNADIVNLSQQVSLAVGISAVIVTLLVALLTVLLLLPLRRLTVAASEIRAGNLEAQIPALPADEIGTLADVMRGLVDRLLFRVQQLNAAVEVSRAAAYSLEVEPLLTNVASTMVRQFDFSAVLIYLTDTSGREARVRASAGPDEDAILQERRAVTIIERNLVGRAILLNEPQIGRISTGTMARRPELAIAMQSAGRSLGAVYILASETYAFEQEDIDVIRLITDQLSSSIENAHLYEQSVANVEEIEALNRRLTRQGWEEYLEDGQPLRVTRDPEQQWPDELQGLQTKTEITAEIYVDSAGRSVLAAPLVLRGETIGTLAVTRPDGRSWSRDETLLMEAVASRLALVAESIRLVEETSIRADREQQVNEVSANLLQRATSVDSVLQTALSQLSGVLGSDHVSLRIGRPPVDDDRQIGAGNGQSDDADED